MTTTDIDIDAIRQREQAATEGPWWAWNRGVGYVIAIGTPSDVDEYDRPQRELPEGMRTDIGRESDAEFIAHARTDVPALLAKVDELTAALAAKDAVVDAAKAWRAQFGEWGPLDSADTPSGDLTDAVDALPKAEATR